MSDRIVLRYEAAEALAQAADEHRDYIMGETLCTTFERVELGDGDAPMEVEIDGMALRFSMTRAVYYR